MAPGLRARGMSHFTTGVTIREAEPAADADVQRGFFSCGCEPCSPGTRAVRAESEKGSPLILAQSAMIPFDEEKAKTLSENLSQEYLNRVQDPKNERSVSKARHELNDFVLRALEDDTTDVETMLGLKGALKIFNEKHQDAKSSRSRGHSSAQKEEVSNVMSL